MSSNVQSKTPFLQIYWKKNWSFFSTMDKNDRKLLAVLQETMKARGVKTPRLADLTGIPRDRIYKWFQDGTHPKERDALVLWSWINGDSSNIVPHETEPSGGYRDKYIKTLEDQTAFLQKMMDVNLGLLAKGQNMIQAQVKTVLQYQAVMISNGDQKKQDQEMLKINTLLAQNVAQVTEKDT